MESLGISSTLVELGGSRREGGGNSQGVSHHPGSEVQEVSNRCGRTKHPGLAGGVVASQHVGCRPNGDAGSSHRFVPNHDRLQDGQPRGAGFGGDGEHCWDDDRSGVRDGLLVHVVQLERVA